MLYWTRSGRIEIRRSWWKVRTILNVTVTKNFVSFITHTNTKSLRFCFFFFCHIYLSQTVFVIVVALSPTLTKNYYYKYDLITLVTFVCSAGTENNNKVYTKKTIHHNNLYLQFFFSRRRFTFVGKKVKIFQKCIFFNFFRTSKTLVFNDLKVAYFILSLILRISCCRGFSLRILEEDSCWHCLILLKFVYFLLIYYYFFHSWMILWSSFNFFFTFFTGRSRSRQKTQPNTRTVPLGVSCLFEPTKNRRTLQPLALKQTLKLTFTLILALQKTKLVLSFRTCCSNAECC